MARRQPPNAPSNDGRVRRGARNRDRIVEAVIALVRRGTPRPSADEIAALAGTGTRTVFRQFSDMEGLFAAVQVRMQAEILPLIDPSPIEGSLSARARELVRRRARVFERLTPFRLSGMPHRRSSAVIRRGHRALDTWNRTQLLTTFAAELRRAPGELVETLDALTSFETWDRLRSAQHLTRARACEVMERAMLAVLAALS
jgi:AcrR family transcriptional regulator